MKITRLVSLSLLAFLPALAHGAAYKGGAVAGYQRPAYALKAQVKGLTAARTIGKLADGSTVIAAQGARGDQIYVLNAKGKLSDAMQATTAVKKVSRGLPTVTTGDASGRGLATLTAHGMRVNVNGKNVILGVRGGKLTTRRDGATARPATQGQLAKSAYQIFEARGGSHGGDQSDWTAAVARSMDGR